MSFRFLAAAALALNTFCFLVPAQTGTTGTYFPGETWRTAIPESQGLDSQALAAAIDQIRQKQWGIHSLLVIRHGYAVADANVYP